MQLMFFGLLLSTGALCEEALSSGGREEVGAVVVVVNSPCIVSTFPSVKASNLFYR